MRVLFIAVLVVGCGLPSAADKLFSCQPDHCNDYEALALATAPDDRCIRVTVTGREKQFLTTYPASCCPAHVERAECRIAETGDSIILWSPSSRPVDVLIENVTAKSAPSVDGCPFSCDPPSLEDAALFDDVDLGSRPLEPAEPECVAGMRQCRNLSTIEECNPQGTGFNPAGVCSAVGTECRDGACVESAGLCEPGTTRCDPDQPALRVQLCAYEGDRWVPDGVCGSEATCVDGNCRTAP